VAGPLDIQRFPRGLLDILGLKATGDAPHLLSQEVSSSLEITPLYLQERRVQLPAALLPAAAGGYQSNAGNTVPSGEMWIVNNLTVVSSPGVGVSANVALGYAWSTTGTLDSFVLTPYTAFPASNTTAVGRDFEPLDLILWPGWSVGYWTNTIAGAFQGTMRADICRIIL
jgi:hypothetical protein